MHPSQRCPTVAADFKPVYPFPLKQTRVTGLGASRQQFYANVEAAAENLRNIHSAIAPAAAAPRYCANTVVPLMAELCEVCDKAELYMNQASTRSRRTRISCSLTSANIYDLFCEVPAVAPTAAAAAVATKESRW